MTEPLATARELHLAVCSPVQQTKEGEMKNLLRSLLREESGQDLIEYALVAAVLALAAVAGMTTLASNISNAFSAVGSKLSSAVA
ncbi:MAG TPA: Flp family type IVb pilin [Chloroflexota bacterium]|nr:Flp family type IVb pilin [Chloroflexota bacterium]HZP24718.1 Flp family type IVb pilin [Terriglobales bacterium]